MQLLSSYLGMSTQIKEVNMAVGGIGVAMQDPDGIPFGITNTRNALDVVLNDSITPTIIAKMNRVTNSTTLTVASVVDTYDITVADATGAVIGSYVVMFSPILVRYAVFEVLAVNALVLTLDSLMPIVFPVGAFVDIGTTDMAVDGSSTPVHFGLRGTGIPPGIESTADITRILITCYTTGIGDLADFGDIAGGLTRGLLFRKRDGTNYNVFNVKTNGEIAGMTMDFDPYAATNPQQGVNGFVSRLTFSGQDKLGVVIRLPLGEDIEMIVQDNLSTLLKLEVVVEGSLTSFGQL